MMVFGMCQKRYTFTANRLCNQRYNSRSRWLISYLRRTGYAMVTPALKPVLYACTWNYSFIFSHYGRVELTNVQNLYTHCPRRTHFTSTRLSNANIVLATNKFFSSFKIFVVFIENESSSQRAARIIEVINYRLEVSTNIVFSRLSNPYPISTITFLFYSTSTKKIIFPFLPRLCEKDIGSGTQKWK